MDPTDPEGGGLDARRRRIHFRAWRRGMREMDLILGPFADAHIHRLDHGALNSFEALLDVPDQELYRWVTGAAPVPRHHRSPLLAELIAFGHGAGPASASPAHTDQNGRDR